MLLRQSCRLRMSVKARSQATWWMARKSHFLDLTGGTFRRKKPGAWSPELFLSTGSNNADYTFASLQTIKHRRTYREETPRTLLTLRLSKSTFNPVYKSWLPFFLPNLTLIFFSSVFFLRWKPSSHRAEKVGGPYGSLQKYDQSSADFMTVCYTEPITFWLQQKGECSLVSAIKSPPAKTSLPPCTRLCNMILYISFHGRLFQSLWYKQ